MGAGTPATALLAANGVPFTLHEYELEPLSGVDQHRGERIAYGDAAAAALGISPERLYKTLVLAIEGAQEPRTLLRSQWCRAAVTFPRRPLPQHSTRSAQRSPTPRVCVALRGMYQAA